MTSKLNSVLSAQNFHNYGECIVRSFVWYFRDLSTPFCSHNPINLKSSPCWNHKKHIFIHFAPIQITLSNATNNTQYPKTPLPTYLRRVSYHFMNIHLVAAEWHVIQLKCQPSMLSASHHNNEKYLSIR